MIEIDSELIKRMAEKGKRIDGRAFDEYRKIEITPGIITSAEGSARVKLGDTVVLAGVKIETGTPFPDTADEGVLMVNSEFTPLASPEFESGPPKEDSVELSRIVDRAIRESKAIDFKKLCITPGEKVWMVYVDIDVLDDDGNLIDASAIAAIAALMNATIPEIDENGKPAKGTKKLPIDGIPISATVVKIGDVIMCDPCAAEISAINSRLTVGSINSKKGPMLCSMQKGGTDGISLEEVNSMMELAEKKGDELRALLS